jgi:transposase
MTRLYGWGPTSERVPGVVPFGHWKTTTFVAAFRLDGLFAPLVIDGALNGELFLKYVRQELAPRLRPGDILVMDNLATHKVSGVAEAVRGRDAGLVYLPAYSPDLNPIEQVFSKVKNELRRRELRTVAEVEDAFGQSLDWVTPTDARGYFGHAGYPPD